LEERKVRRQILGLFSILVVFFLCTSVSNAQGTTSRIVGTVQDSSGSAVGGATVTATNEGNGIGFTAQTSDSGTYTFDLVAAGNYRITVEKTGFKKFVSNKNAAFVNQPATINVTLEVGGVSEIVTVVDSSEKVQTSTSGNVGSTVEQRTIESIPIVAARGRNPLDLLNYQPGIVNGSNTGGGVHVHGSRDRSFNFTLDGVDINESSAGGSNFTPLRPNPESIQEFQVVTSGFTAELGRSSGAQVTFVTRSGTKRFSGNLFDYYQTPKFIANSYVNNTRGVSKPQFIQHIYGGSLGGPLFVPGFGEGTPIRALKDKAFFFVNLQLLRQNQRQLAQRTVYTQTARQGIFRFIQGGRNAPFGTPVGPIFLTGSAVNAAGAPNYSNCSATLTTSCVNTYNIATNPVIGIDQNILASVNSAPLPNDFTRGDGLNTAGYNFLAPTSEKQYDFVSKFDFKINDKNSFYVRYAKGSQNTFNDGGNGGLEPFPGLVGGITNRDPLNLAINYRWSPTSNITNEFIYGFSKFKFFFGNSPTFVPFILNLVTDAGSNAKGNGRGVTTHQFVDNLTYVSGNHILKSGVNFRFGKQVDDRSSVSNGLIEGSISFSRTINNNFNAFNLPTAGATSINSNDFNTLQSQINDYLGRVGAYNQAFVSNADGTAFLPAGSRWLFEAKYPEYDFYFQDTWKARSNLTFDLGLRWEPKLAPTTSGLPVLRPDQPVGIGAPASNTLKWVEGNLIKTDWNNLSPSVGFAWDPFKKGKTSIRANYRLSYDKFGTFVFGSSIFQNAPGNNILFPTTNAFGQGGGLYRNIQTLVPTGTPDSNRQPAAFGSLSQTIIDPNVVYPEIHQWYAGFQQEIGFGSVLEVNYIGKKGVHLFGGYDANQVEIRSNGFLDAFKALKANRGDSTYQNPYFNSLLLGDTRITAADGTATRMLLRLFLNDVTNGSVSVLAAGLAAGGNGRVWETNRGNPFFFQKYPQFTSSLNVLDSEDSSQYHGLEVILKRRISSGIGFQVGYTLAKSTDTRSFDPVFTTVGRGGNQSSSSSPFDNNNRKLNEAYSDFDRRHALQATYVFELPFGKGQKFGQDIPKALDWAIGGWQIAGAFNLASGRPFTVYSQANTLTNVVPTPANCNGCSRNLGSVAQELGTNFFFTQEQRNLFTNPEPGDFSNVGRNYFVGPRQFQTDMSLSKKFRFTETINFLFRVDATNLTNTPSLGLPAATLGGATFGQIRDSVTNASRRMQFSGKLSF
jgi:Carboxypeptidase regulatory-like domain/TonB-dependent Receptor Plug Domain